jgi:hypothetical protein
MDFASLVYRPAYQTFARPVVFCPVASQPGEPPFAGRGIYDAEELDRRAALGTWRWSRALRQ